MSIPEITPQASQRLVDMYRRQSTGGDAGVERYYESGRGYYAPELAGEERDRFAISLATLDGSLYQVGDYAHPFPMHSISKVFSYALALQDWGREAVMRRVGVEPSGDAYNSIRFDERSNRPHNPMINTGALATSALVRGESTQDQLDRIVDLVRRMSGNHDLSVDLDVFEREMETADRNRATAYLMRENGMLSGDVEEIIALYLKQCAITVTCADLAVMGATLANGSANPVTGERILSRQVNRDVLSVMYTCGMYDFAGEWAFQVGVPAKSCVSGGIIAVIPGKLGIGVYSPGLDRFGNSVRGVRVCQEVSEHLGLHLFATDVEDVMFETPSVVEPSAG